MAVEAPARPARHAWLRRTLRFGRRALLGLAAAVGAYFAAAFALGRWPVNADWRSTPGGQAIYLDSNGVHVDLVLPAVVGARDLRADYPLAGDDRGAQWIAFGWGDRAFYLEVEEWEQLTLPMALRATLTPTPTLVHVTHRLFAPQEDEDCVRVTVSEEELARLLERVDAAFERDEEGAPILVAGASHAKNPAGPRGNGFYEARGSYHLFRTCNDWTRRTLTHAGIRAPRWSPFDGPILRHLRGR